MTGIAIVTGARGGIGGASAQRLADDGYRVLATDLQGDIGCRDIQRDSAGEITNYLNPGAITRLALDVTNRDTIALLAASIRASELSLQVLVNAAGVLQAIQPLSQFDDVSHDHVWTVNYTGTYNCCRHFGLLMAEQGGGAIVNISSINAFRSTPLFAYAPGKAAINSLTACLAVELGRDNVRVNGVCPGFTLTPLLQKKMQDGERNRSAIEADMALDQWVEPNDIAAAVAFLVSSEARAITGVSLPVDAGWLAASTWHSFK